MSDVLKILLLGESGVGKTAITQRYIDGTFDNIYTASVGVDYKTKTVMVNDESVRMQIWDTGL